MTRGARRADLATIHSMGASFLDGAPFCPPPTLERDSRIGVLCSCFGRKIDGDSWFTGWFNHPPGKSIYFPEKDTWAHRFLWGWPIGPSALPALSSYGLAESDFSHPLRPGKSRGKRGVGRWGKGCDPGTCRIRRTKCGCCPFGFLLAKMKGTLKETNI